VRIARPKAPDAPFKRRRGPPPQATKLLTASMGAGVVFIVLLGIVFIPRFLENLDQCRSTVLTLEIESGPRLNVTETALVLHRDSFRASLIRNGTEVASLDPGLRNGTAALDFSDVDGDDAVGPGDAFILDASVPGTYRFEVILLCDGRLVGVKDWAGILS